MSIAECAAQFTVRHDQDLYSRLEHEFGTARMVCRAPSLIRELARGSDTLSCVNASVHHSDRSKEGPREGGS